MQSKSDFSLNVIRLNCDFCWCGTKKNRSKFELNTKNVQTDYCKSLNELTASAYHWDFHWTHEMHLFALTIQYIANECQMLKGNGEPIQDREHREKNRFVKNVCSRVRIQFSFFFWSSFFGFLACVCANCESWVWIFGLMEIAGVWQFFSRPR